MEKKKCKTCGNRRYVSADAICNSCYRQMPAVIDRLSAALQHIINQPLGSSMDIFKIANAALNSEDDDAT